MQKKTKSKRSTKTAPKPLRLVSAPERKMEGMATTFSTRNMLVDFTISSFQTRKLDKAVTAEIAKQYQVSESVGNYRKKLYPFVDKDLDALPTRIGALRAFHRANTLPWGNGDTDLRVLPSANFMAYSEGIREGRLEIEALVAKIAARLPELQERARKELERQAVTSGKSKSMYNPADYPDAAQFTSRHAISVKFLPIPDADNARNIEHLDPAQIEIIRQDACEQLLDSQSAAMNELWVRVLDIVRESQTRLGKKGAQITGLFEKVEALCELAPRLNFENNPQLTEILDELRETMATTDPTFIKKVPAVRKRVTDSLADIEKKMAAFMPRSAAA